MDCLGQRALPHRAGICCTCGRTKRLCSVTASLGRRKNLCMVESMSSVEQRLRRVTNHKCDLCLCRDDAFDAQTTCCLILFKQALRALSMECASLRLVLTQRTQAECFLGPD